MKKVDFTISKPYLIMGCGKKLDLFSAKEIGSEYVYKHTDRGEIIVYDFFGKDVILVKNEKISVYYYDPFEEKKQLKVIIYSCDKVDILGDDILQITKGNDRYLLKTNGELRHLS